MSKLCLIYNTAPKYREAIFTAIDKEYDCDWYFGETKSDIKEMDLSLLKSTQYYKSFGNPKRVYWQGALIPSLFSKKYKNYFVLCETRSISFWLMVLLKKLFFPKKKLYGWSHGWYGKEGRIQRFLDRLKTNMMDGLFVYNSRARDLMIEGGIKPEKLFVIRNSLDYKKQLMLRQTIHKSDIYKKKFQNNNPVLVFIGRLTKVKRLDELIDAVKLLKENGEYFNIDFIGDGEDRKALEERVNSSHVSCWFYGACYDETKNAELIYNADLCVSPGNIGLTAIHSLMFGTPAITNNDYSSQMPEFEAIIQGKTGDIFEKNNVNSIAGCISSWFKNHIDRENVRQACYSEIDMQWNPDYQMRVIRENLILI